MSFFLSSKENYSFRRDLRASPANSLTPHSQISSYFEKFEKNASVLANSRQFSQIRSESKQIASRNSTSQEIARPFSKKLAHKYGKTASIYISVDEILGKSPAEKQFSQVSAKKTGKSCSTHLLRPASSKEARNLAEKSQIFNIYSQKSADSEKSLKMSQIMRRFEGIQRNFEEKLLYNSLDYAKKSQRLGEACDFQEKSREILRNVSNTQEKLKETAEIAKKVAGFEKENASSQYFCRINEKLYSKIVNSSDFLKKKCAKAAETLRLAADIASNPSFSANLSQKLAKNPAISCENLTISSKKPPILCVGRADSSEKPQQNRVFAAFCQFSQKPREIPEKLRNCCIDDFQIGKCLGKGRFGSVFLAKDKRSQGLVALKVIKKKLIKDSKMANQIKNEIKIQSCLNHPNVLSFYGFFQDSEQFYLVLEYAPHGELYKKLKKQVSL